MIQSRIREIRKRKGLTLQELAERAGTTAQTIGRLETGMRTLSLKWVERIAEALATDAAELLALPEEEDIAIAAEWSAKAGVKKGAFGSIAVRLAVKEPVALKMAGALGEFRRGDLVVFEKKTPGPAAALGKLVLAEDAKGRLLLGRLVGGAKAGELFLVPEGGIGRALPAKGLRKAAVAAFLFRPLTGD
ncbi:MAG TPA: helix-turn-helix transcriptional regulator [Sphingomonadales bacterium]|nr:helix-turn-helix transcriptional regulator [Sphingomonadales bacterium]